MENLGLKCFGIITNPAKRANVATTAGSFSGKNHHIAPTASTPPMPDPTMFAK